MKNLFKIFILSLSLFVLFSSLNLSINKAEAAEACIGDACVIGDDGSGTPPPDGTPPDENNTTYPCMYVSFSANPSTIVAGQSSTLSWSTTGTCVNASISSVGSVSSSGSQSVTPSSTTTYIFTAWSVDQVDEPVAMTTTVTVTPAPSGSISASSCSIPAGAYKCNSNISWSTTNPIGTSAVTTPTNLTVASGNSGSTTYSVSYGSRTFYLYNNSSLLSQSTATASCATNTSWNGSTCQALTCTPPTSETQTLSCNVGYTGSITQTRTKSAYPSCTWGDWITTSNTCTINTYTITATTGSNGTVTPAGVTTKNYGSNQTYSITPSTNYSVSNVLVDGVSIGAVTSYTFPNITANHTISATFSLTACANGATNPPTCTTCVSGSVIISGTCTPVTVGVTPSPTTYSTTPSTNISFTYTPTTNSGQVQCKLLDNNQADLTSYVLATKDVVNTKTYSSPSGIGSYGYYIRCQNTTTTTAVATSSLITVTTACLSGTTWDPVSSSCKAPTGTISSPNCTITAGNNSCNTTVTWETLNPLPMVTSYITIPPSTDSIASGNPGTLSYPVSYGSKTFSLNHNYQILASSTSNATCQTPGTKWISPSCVEPTGDLSITSCIIPIGDSSCNISLEWSTTNPIGISAVTTPINITIATGNDGTKSYSMSYGSKDFYLYNDTVKLDQVPVTVTCANESTWDGVYCKPDAPSESNTTFYPTPGTVFKGRSSTLTWNSLVATSCSISKTLPLPVESNIASGGKTGTKKVIPLVNTTYELTCVNDADTTTFTTEVKVTDPKMEEN